MNVSPRLLLIFSVAAFLASSGCSDEPGPVGIHLLPARDSVRIATVTATTTYDQSFVYRTNGAGANLLTGMSNGMEARTLLGFTGLSQIHPWYTIDSATILLNFNYRFLDSVGVLAFEVRNMLKRVVPSTFRWDSSTVAGAYSDTVSGRVIKVSSPLDSTVTVNIDTTLIRQWTITNSGSMIFLPQGTIVAGFRNTANIFVDYRPLMTIYWRDTSGNSGALPIRSSWGIFVADGSVPFPTDRITLQAGMSTRGIVRLDSVPVPPKSSVVEAMLQVAIDTTQSLTNKFTVDAVDAFLLQDATAPYDSLILGVSLTPAYDNGQKVYQANVRFIVQQWLLHAYNRGILLRATGEQTTLDRIVLFGSSAPAALRPKLTITYSLVP